MKFKFVGKNNVSRLPKSCGVYVFKKGGQILYIGKAANLRERVKNHSAQAAFRDNLFINQVERVGFIKTDSEIEALILEAKLIKKYQPKYNVIWRDDKNYFYTGITKEPFPRIFITHQPQPVSRILYPVSGIKSKKIRNTKYKIQNTKFVGPFVDGGALKQTLKILRKIFPYRNCRTLPKKPCLWYQLGRCPGPCLLSSKLAREMPKLEKTIKKESQKNVRSLKKILEGGKNQSLKNLKKEMKNASRIRDFERAAKIRDQIRALEKVIEHATIFDWIEPGYSRKRRSPFSRGWKETEKKLKIILKTSGEISRIEAYDVSNIQGQNATGSMITFINGGPNKNFYRRFKIENRAPHQILVGGEGEKESKSLFALTGKPNDVAMLKEVLTRRFQHSEWGWPDLILIDGGIGQLSAALKIKNQIPSFHLWKRGGRRERSSLRPSKIKNKIKIISLAKKENKLFIEGQKNPTLLKNSPREIFNLILQLRDEAHRFAISYHRKLRERF